MFKKQSNKTKKRIGLLLTAGCMLLPLGVQAEEATIEEYELEQVNVTALRHVMKNLDTPADIKVYSAEQLKRSGAANVADALKFADGINYHSMGPRGQSFSSMTSKVIMRGVESGTLLMVNGIPQNLNGKYYLDQIPLEQVEKIEIIKGAGAVLYGSDAMGGVINIITKKKMENSVTVAGGTLGQDYNLSLQAGKAGFVVGHSYYGESGPLTDAKTDKTIGATGTTSVRNSFGDTKKDNLLFNYQFDDDTRLQYSYLKSDYNVRYREATSGDLVKNWNYTDVKNGLQIEHKANAWNHKLYWNQQELDYKGVETARPDKPEWSSTKNSVLGFDSQVAWAAGENNLLAGLTVQRESYEQTARKLSGNAGPARKLGAETQSGPFERNQYALYGQWEHPLSKKSRLILSARQQLLSSERGDYNAFCPQFQTITRIDDSSSWYTNIGKSFNMPDFSAMYYDSDKFIANADLKPETAYNYELGYKKQTGNGEWRIAFFKTDINDKIRSVKAGAKSQMQNADKFRNLGLEVSYNEKLSEKFNYALSASVSNPQFKEGGGEWQRTLGRVQLTGSLNYQCGADSVSLSASYFGDRVDSDGLGRRPMLPMNLHYAHQINETSTFFFDIDNLLNRDDITTNSSAYYAEPRSYRLGMTMRF